MYAPACLAGRQGRQGNQRGIKTDFGLDMKKWLLKFNSWTSVVNPEIGQTLIETLAALFILTMGVSAATGLAVYAFSASSNINKQIIATGIAREGIEAVRNMRDTNWLLDTLAPTGCYNYTNSTANNAPCYLNWLGRTGALPFHCIFPDSTSGNTCSNTTTATMNYSLGLTSPNSTGTVWTLTKQASPGNNNFGMTFNTTNTGTGFYTQSGTIACGAGVNAADYCRKIVITNYSVTNGNVSSKPPYDKDDNLSLVEVQSEVWWVDKKCPRVSDYGSANPACRIELDTYLTNWKNY